MSFILNEYRFENMSTEYRLNVGYFQDVLKLISKHKDFILHDYLPKDADGLIKLIDTLYPWFFLIFKDNVLQGFIYCYGWLGYGGKFHSCFLTAAATKAAYGKDSRKILTLFCNYLYDVFGVIKIRAEVNRENILCSRFLEACRFKKEGFLKCSVLKEGKPQDTLIYGKINPVILRGKKGEAPNGVKNELL